MAEKVEVSTRWTGHDLLDVDGSKIGTVSDVLLGDVTGGLKWLVVETGLLGSKKVLVPSTDVRTSGDDLVVPFTKDRVKKARGIDRDENISQTEERELCIYYGLEYVSSETPPVEGCAGSEATPETATTQDETTRLETDPPKLV
jgi:sporulation protein YlmC with PRC-barrel domain